MSTFVDGNAIGATLMEIFGREMTGELECCGECGSVSPIGAVRVYSLAPGDVLRCPFCDTVLMVIVRGPGSIRIGMGALSWIRVDAD